LAPFVTETIWQTLSWRESLLMREDWPDTVDFDATAADNFEKLQALISEIRLVSAELKVKGGHSLLYIDDPLIDDNTALIKHLARLGSIEPTDSPKGLRLAVSGRRAWLDIDEKTLAKYRDSLEQRLKSAQQQIKSLEARLANEAYINKAPAALVEETREQLEEQKALIVRLERELAVTVTE